MLLFVCVSGPRPDPGPPSPGPRGLTVCVSVGPRPDPGPPSPGPGSCSQEHQSVVHQGVQDQGYLSHTQHVQSRCHSEVSHRRMLVSRG